jgi:hypothetical protein
MCQVDGLAVWAGDGYLVVACELRLYLDAYFVSGVCCGALYLCEVCLALFAGFWFVCYCLVGLSLNF